MFWTAIKPSIALYPTLKTCLIFNLNLGLHQWGWFICVSLFHHAGGCWTASSFHGTGFGSILSFWTYSTIWQNVTFIWRKVKSHSFGGLHLAFLSFKPGFISNPSKSRNLVKLKFSTLIIEHRLKLGQFLITFRFCIFKNLDMLSTFKYKLFV